MKFSQIIESLEHLKAVAAAKKLYLAFLTFMSGFVAYYTDIHLAVMFFLAMTVLDTVSAIHVTADAKGLKFNPFKKYFWKEISSDGIRQWMKKVFGDYGYWALISFALNKWVLQNMVIFDMFDRQYTLPVVMIYIFGGIELWSIGENREKLGKKNYLKMLFGFLPEKIQQIFKKDENEYRQ